VGGFSSTHLKRGGRKATKEEDGRAPRIAASGDAACGNPVRLRGDTYLRPDLDAVWDYAGFDVAP